MNRVLRFKHHLRVEPVDADRVFLVGERERFLLRGRAHALVASRLDGARTVAEILAELEGEAPEAELYYAITLLEERGYVAEVRPLPSPEAAAYWESIGLDAALAVERLGATTVAVEATGAEDPRPLIEALTAMGITVADEGAAVRVVLVGSYLSADLAARSRDADARRARWMPVKASGVECWIGPMFGAEGGPCWACLASRLRANQPVEAYLQRLKESARISTPPRAAIASSVLAGLHLAALALARWIAEGAKGPIDGKLISVDTSRLQIGEHAVARRPQCPVCGDPELVRARALAPVSLSSQAKRFTLDGGHRAFTPEETLARHAHHISPITGVVGEVRPLRAGDDPLRQLYGAVFRVCPFTAIPSFDDFHRAGSGKGRTAAQARTGALCEAIERYSAVFQGDEHRICARRSELGDDAVPPGALQCFSERQHRERRPIRSRSDLQWAVPPAYEDQPIDWTPAWSLTHERRRWIPTSSCYLYTPSSLEEQFAYFNSNGAAAGNSLEEAILQGFLELVERDAVAVWWYNRLLRPGVDLQSFGEPYFLELAAAHRAMGADLHVLDLTHDLGIPVFVAIARDAATGRIWAGCGCHFEARLAVQRALTELNQCFDPRDRGRSPWTASDFAELDYLFPDPAAVARKHGDWPAVVRDDLRDDVRACVEAAARVGLETLVLDQTRPDVGLSVVRVIVPGLRHFWSRLGPGRLYDVPVQLGWRKAPLDEAQMNPMSFYF